MPTNQSGFIFAFIVLGFIIFITLRGELPTYAGLLLLSPPSGGTTGNTQSSSATSQAASQAASLGLDALLAA